MRISDNDLKRVLAELPEIELPAGFHNEVMAKIREEGKPKKKKPLNFRVIGSFAAAAALVIIVAATIIDFGSRVAEITETPAAALAPAMDMDVMNDELFPPLPSLPFTFQDSDIALGEAFDTEEDEFGWGLELRAGAAAGELYNYGFTLAVTYEITIIVDDMAYALNVINGLGGHILQPAHEELDYIFSVLHTLGVVSTQRHIATEWEQNNTISITLLQN